MADLVQYYGTGRRKSAVARVFLRPGGGNFVVPLFRQGYNGDQDGTPVDALPHYIPPNENPQTTPALAKRYPLSLITPKSHAFLNSNYGNLPAQTLQAGGEEQSGAAQYRHARSTRAQKSGICI